MPLAPELPPLIQLLNQIDEAATGGLDLLAISMAVSIPAICASLGNPAGRSERDDYKAWCTKNLTGTEFSFVTADDLYSMRCGVLHRGRFGDLKHNVSRVIFVPPVETNTIMNCKTGDAYLYGVVEFCRAICDAAHRWYLANWKDPVVAANSERMMQYYPQGIRGLVGGIRIIA